MGTNVRQNIVTNGLVMYLDAGSRMSYPGSGTTWSDLSGNNNSGSLAKSGSLSISASFNPNNQGSITFDGTGSYALLATSSLVNFTTNFSISYWINRTTGNIGINPRVVQVGRGGVAGYGAGVAASTNTHRFTKMGILDIETTIASSLNTWEHITWVVPTNNNATLYKNSILTFASPNATAITSTTASAYIACDASSDGSLGNFFAGSVAQVMVYNRALSAQEIAQNYNATKTRFGLT